MLCYNKDVNGFPTFQHLLKRSWREGESLFWKVPFDNIAYFQIGKSNDKPYEPARVCQETAICQGGERGEAKDEFINSFSLCCISQLYKLPSCPVAISRFTRTSSPRMRKCCCQPTHEVPTSSHPCWDTFLRNKSQKIKKRGNDALWWFDTKKCWDFEWKYSQLVALYLYSYRFLV